LKREYYQIKTALRSLNGFAEKQDEDEKYERTEVNKEGGVAGT
jgi:hypothetical protein